MTTATLTESATEADIFPLLPIADLSELDALGDNRDWAKWRTGDIARSWIDDNHLPVRLVCGIIGRRVDYGEERVRQLLYTSRYFYDQAELRRSYDQLKHSIFEHARKCSDPEAVLRAALEGPLSVGLVKAMFPPAADELKDLIGRVPQHHKEAAQQIINRCIGGLKELID